MALPHRSFLLLVMLFLSAAAPLVAAEWAMDGANPSHTSVQETGIVRPRDQWQYDAGAEVLYPPSAAYGQLFLGTTNGWLLVLDEVQGNLEWRLRLGECLSGTPLVESQTIFAACQNLLHAVSRTTQSVKWSYETVGNIRGSPMLDGDTVYIASEDKHVYALDEYSGELRWKIKLDDVIAASPSIAGNTLVVGTESGVLFGIHRSEGTEAWSVDLGSPISTAACIDRDVAVVGTYGGRVHGVDADDAELLWTYPPEAEDALDAVLSTPAASSGLVYFGSDGLYCLEIASGIQAWHQETGDYVRGGPAISDDYLLFGCYDGMIRCLDKTTGSVIWKFQTSSSIRSAASIDYDKAYLGSRDGILYAKSILNGQHPVVSGPRTLETKAHDSIAFEVEASDPEGNLLSYIWDFDDGNTSKEESPLHAYSSAGVYNVTVTVSDGSLTKKFKITVTVHALQNQVSDGDPPTVSVALIAGAAGGAVVIIIIVIILFLRRRGSKSPQEASEEEPKEPPMGRPEELWVAYGTEQPAQQAQPAEAPPPVAPPETLSPYEEVKP
jgi:outer membrane protein assembly factor BamB